jgi:hypothetical protein
MHTSSQARHCRNCQTKANLCCHKVMLVSASCDHNVATGTTVPAQLPSPHLEEVHCGGSPRWVSIKAGAHQGLQWPRQALRQRRRLLGHTHSCAYLHERIMLPRRRASHHVQQRGGKAPDVHLVGGAAPRSELLWGPAAPAGTACCRQHLTAPSIISVNLQTKSVFHDTHYCVGGSCRSIQAYM